MSIFVGDNKVAGIGNPGKTGKPGESAYEIAKKYGYEGTEEEFADGLIIASETNSKLEAHNEDPESHADLREMIANAGGKANWAINDPEEPGYISNRTHWVEQSSEVCVDNINIVAQQQNENLGMAMAPFSMKIVENKTYSVIWDNQTYECIPYRDPVGQILAIGNGAMAGGLTEGNNEPFFFAEIEDGVIILIFDDGANEHTITVIKNEEKIHYLDPKYIKDMYYETLEIETIFEDLTFADYDSGNAPQCTFIENDVYHVIWNDVLYEDLICWFDGEFNILGNSNDNLPFYIDDDGGNDLYIDANDGSTNWTVTILKEKSLINPINPKYIKDMYYETPSKEVIFYSNTFEFNDTNQYPIYNSPMLTEGNTYIVSFLGNIYECVGRYDGFGSIYIGNQEVSPGWGFPEIIESNEPFFFATFSDDNGIFSVEEYFGEVTITIKEIQGPIIHHLPSKYIKDMYSEDINYNTFSTYIDMQSNGFPVDWGQSKYGYMVDELNAGFTLEEGKIYKFSLYGNEAEFIAFKENEYGNIIIGNGAFVADSNEDNGLPFAYGIYEEGDTFHYFIVEDEYYQGPISISNTEINITKIPEKYLSILEEKEKDIFNGIVQTDNIYPLSQKEILTGEYFILFNGMLNKVNFIEYTDGASFVETSNYAVKTVKNGENVSLSFWSESGNHSLRIFKKQNTIKEEYLSDGIGSGSGNGVADWNQNNPEGEGYIKNRTHYDKTGERVTVIDESGQMKEFLHAGEEYVFTMDGVEYYTTCLINMYAIPYVDFIIDQENQYYFCVVQQRDAEVPIYSINSNVSFDSGKLERVSSEIKQIDQKYINIDWNGNNSAIKNRTHFSSYEYEKESIIFNGELYDQYGYGQMEFSQAGVPFSDINMGFTYLIVLNGKEYICKSHQFVMDYRGPHLGNSGINYNYWCIPIEQRQYWNTGEPFLIAYNWEDLCLFVENSYQGATYSLEIYKLKEKEKVHHLDSKYIKDMYGEFSNTTLVLPETYLIAMNESDYRQEGDWIYIGSSFFYLEPSTAKIYMVKLNGVWYDNCTVNQYGVLRDSSGQELFPINYYEGYAYIKNGYSCTLEVREKHNPSIKKISHKYIPTDAFILKDQVTGYENIIELHNGELKISCKSDYLEITSMPTKTQYMQGEKVDLSGLEIYAICQNGSRRVVTDYSYPEYIDTSMINNIEIKYTECDTEYIVLIPVTITPFETSLLNDFDYNLNENGTYNLTAWKGTYNGESSTKIIIPDNALLEV